MSMSGVELGPALAFERVDGLWPNDLRALDHVLRGMGAVSARTLAGVTGWQQGYASQRLANLFNLGFVVRERSGREWAFRQSPKAAAHLRCWKEARGA